MPPPVRAKLETLAGAGKALRARGEETDGRERPGSGPRGAPGSRDRPGARAAAAARSRPARPLGVARARGGRGHGHARRPVGARRGGGGETPRARAPACGRWGGWGARLARRPPPPLRLLSLTSVPTRPRPWAVPPRPHPGVPARLSGRGTSFAPQHSRRQNPLTQLRPHTRVLRRRSI